MYYVLTFISGYASSAKITEIINHVLTVTDRVTVNYRLPFYVSQPKCSFYICFTKKCVRTH